MTIGLKGTNLLKSGFVIPAKAGIQEGKINKDVMGAKQPAVYILASKRNGTLYVGVTSDLIARVWAHKSNHVAGFTNDHSVHTLVYFELHAEMRAAISREKQIKKWNRAWKIKLIEQANPSWIDLFDSIK